MTGMPRRADMFLDLADDPREDSPPVRGERATLREYLRLQRLTLEIKCSGLDPAQLAERSVPPSTMSLLGLVRHLADMERGWMRRRMAGLDAPRIFGDPGNPDGDFDGAVADPAVVEQAWRIWRQECAFTDEFVAAAPDLDLLGKAAPADDMELREVLIHIIEEYGRHMGHADLLRERIDGRVGQ
jgi:uncharacterized damage-inducible protein DinB